MRWDVEEQKQFVEKEKSGQGKITKAKTWQGSDDIQLSTATPNAYSWFGKNLFP